MPQNALSLAIDGKGSVDPNIENVLLGLKPCKIIISNY